jgi:hypothetical protein
VRKVLNRSLGTGVVLAVAFLGAGPVPAPLQATARAGGIVAGHAAFNHGDFRGFVGQPLVRPGQMPSVVVNVSPAATNRMSGNRISGFAPARLHRRIFGIGLPVVGVGVSYGPFDDPIADGGAIHRPRAVDDSASLPEGGDRILRGDCRSETRMVSSEAGGERPIRITWCRKG